MNTPTQILLVSSARSTENVAINEDFAARLSEKFSGSFAIQIVHYDDIAFYFEAGKPAVFLLNDNHTPITDFDLVYIKSYNGRKGNDYVEQANALALCLQSLTIPFVGHEVTQAISLTKLSQYARLTTASFPIPDTVFVASKQLAAQYELVAAKLGTPFVLKDIGGFGGQANFLIKDSDHFQEIVSAHPQISFVAQKFIANDGDLRILTVGKEAKMVISRRRTDDTTHLNNTSQGADAQLLPLNSLDPVIIDMAIRAADLFKREIAGVDVMFETGTGKPYILEVNAGPQVGSGAFIDEKIVVIGEFLKDLTKTPRSTS